MTCEHFDAFERGQVPYTNSSVHTRTYQVIGGLDESELHVTNVTVVTMQSFQTRVLVVERPNSDVVGVFARRSEQMLLAYDLFFLNYNINVLFYLFPEKTG